MAQSIIGIDIGNQNLKIASLRKSGGQYLIESLHSEKLGNLAARRGNEFNIQGCAAIIKRVFETHKISPKKCVIGLNGKEVIFKYVDVPPIGDAKIRKLLEFEAAESSKSIQQETLTDYQLLTLPRESGALLALVGTARSSDLDEDARLLKAAKAPINGIVPKSLALNALLADSNSVSQGEVALLIDIGAESTEIILTQGSSLMLSRSANVGGKNFTEAIARQFGVIPEVAEEIKLAEGSIIIDGRRPSRMAEFREGFDELIAAEGIKFRNDPRYAQNLSRCLTSAADQIRMVCDAALRFATVQTKLKNIKVDRVILSGGGAKLPGLMEYFSSAFRVKCDYWDAISIFDYSNVTPDKRDTPTEYANALALAYVASKSKPGTINLIPSSVKEKMRFWSADLFAYAGVILVALGMVLWFLSLSAQSGRISKENKEVKELSSDTKDKKKKLKKLEGLIDLSRTRIDLLARHTYVNPMVIKFLTEVEKKTPDTIKITDIAFEHFTPGDESSDKKGSGQDLRFVISGFVNKDVAEQQQPSLFSSFAKSLAELPYVLPEYKTTELGRIDKEQKTGKRSTKNQLVIEKGSYLFSVYFVVTENGKLKYNEIK